MSEKMIELDLEAFNRVSKACSKQINPFSISGVLVKDIEDKRRYVATNGHILFLIETKKPKDDLPESGIILKPTAVFELENSRFERSTAVLMPIRE